jgi:hypothetical protein
MNREYRRDYTDTEKPKYSMKNLSQCHLVNHKSETERPAFKPSSQSERPVNECLSLGTANYFGGTGLHH